MTKKEKRLVRDKMRELQRLVGKRVIGFELNTSLDIQEVLFNPVLVFDDGTKLRFKAHQSEDEIPDGVTPYIESTN
jgi:hypothetical protein